MDAILKVWHQIENLTPSIDMYLLEEQSCQIHPHPIWNDWALGFFEEHHPNSNKNNIKMNSDMDSVPDSKKVFSKQNYWGHAVS